MVADGSPTINGKLATIHGDDKWVGMGRARIFFGQRKNFSFAKKNIISYLKEEAYVNTLANKCEA